MFKKFTILIFVAALVACVPQTKEGTGNYIMPEGLKDCKMYRMHDGSTGFLVIVRCPNSSTSVAYPSGKSKAYSVTVEH